MKGASFDPLRSTRFLLQIARRFALYFLALSLLNFVLFLILLIARFGGAASLDGFIQVISVLLDIAVIIAFWLLPVPGLLRQWSKLISYQAPNAGVLFACMTEQLARHATPYDSLQVRELCPPGEGRREYLELRRGVYAGDVSCFPHGNDLYVGWTFWIYMSPLRLLLMRIGRNIQNYRGHGNDMYQTLRYESTRATISALVICTRESIRRITGEPGDAGSAAAAEPERFPSLG